jgi:hypothetical protein
MGLILTRHVFHWEYVIIRVLSTISRHHVRRQCLPCIIQNSVCPRFKFGYIPLVFWKKIILWEHGTKANCGGAKMSNNRQAVNRNFLQSDWTSDRLSLYNSHPASEWTHPNQHRERLSQIRKTMLSVTSPVLTKR